jgi:hypothetical protein
VKKNDGALACPPLTPAADSAARGGNRPGDHPHFIADTLSEILAMLLRQNRRDRAQLPPITASS